LQWHGQGTERDPDKAFSNLKKAANSGSNDAQQFLDDMHHECGYCKKKDHLKLCFEV
jgi:TPR repeat protein